MCTVPVMFIFNDPTPSHHHHNGRSLLCKVKPPRSGLEPGCPMSLRRRGPCMDSVLVYVFVPGENSLALQNKKNWKKRFQITWRTQPRNSPTRLNASTGSSHWLAKGSHELWGV